MGIGASNRVPVRGSANARIRSSGRKRAIFNGFPGARAWALAARKSRKSHLSPARAWASAPNSAPQRTRPCSSAKTHFKVALPLERFCFKCHVAPKKGAKTGGFGKGSILVAHARVHRASSIRAWEQGRRAHFNYVLAMRARASGTSLHDKKFGGFSQEHGRRNLVHGFSKVHFSGPDLPMLGPARGFDGGGDFTP